MVNTMVARASPWYLERLVVTVERLVVTVERLMVTVERLESKTDL